MASTAKIPMRNVTVNLKNVPTYEGVAYGISVAGHDGKAADILVVGPTAEAVATAIHAAWPKQPVAMDKMSRVNVVASTNIEDEEL